MMRVIPVILACLAVMLPLLGSQVLFFPAAWGQALAFRILVSLCLVFALFQIRQWPDFLARLAQAKSVLIPLGSFATILLLALLFSEDRYMSFWGLPTRAWGIAHLIPLFLFALFVFLFLRKTDWKWVWGSAFAAGLAMTLVALSQQQGWFSDALVQYPRPPGTLGNSIFLGMYLLSLTLIAFSFAFANIGNPESRRGKGLLRLLLTAISSILAGGVLLSLSRGALFGLGAGLLFFFALFPGKSRIPRFFTLFLLVGGIALFLFINAAPNPFPEFPLASNMWDRLQSENLLDQARILGWQSVLQGVAEKPFLGYGPYNSFIPFNAHFNPVLTEVTGSTGYWDTAHNEFLDILAGSGALGLLAYLGFLGALLWQLEKAKRRNPNQKFLLHGMQTALVGQHVALLFFPNTFATSLIFFLAIGYSLSLISKPLIHADIKPTQANPHKSAVSALICVLLIFFNWQITLVPLFINGDINRASILAESNKCEPALALGEQTLQQGTFINYYSRLKYVDLISACMGRAKTNVLELSGKAVASLQKEVAVRPKEPRTWILLGGYTNNLAAATKNESEKLALLDQARNAFEKAYVLSPKRPELFAEWANTELLAGDLAAAKEKTTRCLLLDGNYSFCWFQLALEKAKTGDNAGAMRDLNQFENAKGRYELQGEGKVLQMAQAFTSAKEKPYEELAKLYLALTKIRPNNPQYFASLAAAYRELGQYLNARDTARIVAKLQPENQQAVDQFLQTLPPQYR